MIAREHDHEEKERGRAASLPSPDEPLVGRRRRTARAEAHDAGGGVCCGVAAAAASGGWKRCSLHRPQLFMQLERMKGLLASHSPALAHSSQRGLASIQAGL